MEFNLFNKRDNMKQYEGYKKCSKCDCIYPIIMFQKDKQQVDGLRCICKDCSSIDCKKYFNEYHDEILERQKIRYRTIDGKLSTYRKVARKYEREFKLTKDEFAAIISQPCYYCGELQENFNGIDRMDNSKGYELYNCVPCCSMCNRMKNNYNINEFMNKCKLIIEKNKLRVVV